MTPIQQLMLGVGASKKTYLDDVFSTYLYTGSGTSTAYNNGIDLQGEGGMVWIKDRDSSNENVLFDTERGATKLLVSDENYSEATSSDSLTSFNNNGFTVGNYANANASGPYASWTFRKAPGFFDVVTYTGNGSSSGRQIAHNLGSVPGCIMVKCTSATNNWAVYHRGTDSSIPENYGLNLNNTNARVDNEYYWHDTKPTSTHFTVRDNANVNDNGETYVAYVFAGGESTAATARSVDFDGTGDYLSTSSSSSDFTMGTGDFTIEAWVKMTASSSNNGVCHLSATSGGLSSSNPGEDLGIFQNSNVWKCWAAGTTRVTTIKPVVGVWTHLALVRHSGKTTLYVNGVQGFAPVTDTWNYDDTYIAVGGYYDTNYLFEGRISNFRVVKGTAVYTSSFRPPTEPLTNITNTKLLCCNDSSTTGSTVTPVTLNSNGDPTASTDSPFDDPAAFTFGDSKEGIIKCGSYVGNGSNLQDVFLGFEPQWVMIKCSSNSTTHTNWAIYDSMRGVVSGGNDRQLVANDNDAEESGNNYATSDLIEFTSTGFKVGQSNWDVNHNTNETYIYIAIRRPDGYVGKPVEAGTDVFAMDTGNGTAGIPDYDSTFPVDFAFKKAISATDSWYTGARLMQGRKLFLDTTASDSSASYQKFDSNAGWNADADSSGYQSWMFKRHAGFDVVAYEGNGSTDRDIRHNLNKIPEMIWVKRRDSAYNWGVYHKGANGGTNPHDYLLVLNATSAESYDPNYVLKEAPTSISFKVGNSQYTNVNNGEYIAILFASVDGISKVGSYTGWNWPSTQDIDCGFQPRFVVIKKVTGTGGNPRDWHVFDTLRGIAGSGGNDSYLEFNSNSGEFTNSNYLDLTSSGFSPKDGDIHSGTDQRYIFYAHA